MDSNLITRIFDVIASTVGRLQGTSDTTIPDLSDIRIDHLINDEELNDPARLYAKSDSVPDIAFKRTARMPYVDIYDGSYPSPVETAFPENNTVYVKHYKLRAKEGGGPTVIMINGLNIKNNFYFDWWCWRFAAWGLSSVLVNIPYAQKRVPAGSFDGQYTILPDTAWTMLALKQSFLDVQQMANWLKAEGAGEIGTFGVSFGALISGIYVCQAANADFTVIGMPPMDMAEIVSRWSFADYLRELEAKGQVTMLTDPRARRLFNMAEMTPNVALNKIFIAKGKYDHLVSPESIDRTAQNWGGLPWLMEYPTGHINTFVFNFEFIADVKRFIFQEILDSR